MPISRVLILTCGMLLSAATSAYACPPGTVFSHFGENCHWKGQGTSEAVRCNVVKRGSGSCPAGWVGRRSDETRHDLCCPRKFSYDPPAKCVSAVRKPGPGNSVKVQCVKWAM